MMSYKKMKAKMDRFFANTTPEELAKKLEDKGYRFEHIGFRQGRFNKKAIINYQGVHIATAIMEEDAATIIEALNLFYNHYKSQPHDTTRKD